MSVYTYEALYKICKHFGGDVWPNYHYIWEMKSFCRPPRDTYFISEMLVEIPLKVLAHHTLDRILKIPSIKVVITKLVEESPTNTIGKE